MSNPGGGLTRDERESSSSGSNASARLFHNHCGNNLSTDDIVQEFTHCAVRPADGSLLHCCDSMLRLLRLWTLAEQTGILVAVYGAASK